MSKSKITFTNINNIDEKKYAVIDSKKIETKIYDSDMDVLLFENINTGKKRKSNLISVSLYDDLIIKGKEKFKILHMLTKPSFDEKEYSKSL